MTRNHHQGNRIPSLSWSDLEECASFVTIKAFVTSDDPSPDLTTIDATDMTLRQIEDRNSPAQTDIVFALKAQGNAFFGAKVSCPL
jgi:hypothetical protein